ncbi:MAG: (Fe-S)-binding protein [Deltaproteobacteria bacterium]|nr:(Fe-S)-binding protein [Deltaproteobacteria bacterium]MBW2119288.1 (Fe-S)-binding protein [Deltaproteobacteria bacterium]MBW2344904.1 (Fe-S)-binding protein [Deltaproteobacteria bacterium]
MTLTHPAAVTYLGLSGYVFAWLILVSALSIFSYIIYKRYLLIRAGKPDPRFSDIGKRVLDLIVYGFIQKRQPRYLWAGLIHIMIFWGFVVLGLRSIDLVSQGLSLPFLRPLMQTGFGPFYDTFKDIFELVVLGACLWAILRRALIKHERYEGSHTFEAYFVLCLIAFLMITDMFYEGSALLLNESGETFLPASRLAVLVLSGSSPRFLTGTHIWSYWLHLMTFFFFLNFLPLGKHFHIITALPNVFLRKLEKGAIKPAQWGVEDIDELETLGVEKFEDFTWKHILDFYTCTECGRCSDNCPANITGRPLSPKLLTLKLRDHGYRKVPVFGYKDKEGAKENEKADALPMIGGLISHDEIWSCTTCGACEEECPVFIEYIDKIIDMRRHLIETSQNPKTFNKVLMHFEKTGNPFGKPATKRADWVKELEDTAVRVLKEGDETDVLYFVDSYGSFDPAAQAIAGAIVKGLNSAGIDFGILGPLEKDSGHQVRRMGEEGLFQLLIEENMETLSSVRFKRIITTDPHAFNTLKKDYPGDFEVFHYTQFFQSLVEAGQLRPAKSLDTNDVYTYHDPCYLGRHNGIYNEPRQLLGSIPGLKLVEMAKSRDRSFCCGGGDIVLWHEIEQEEIRMASMRIQMAKEAGANVIVTACPFCFIHFEDAIKTDGLENELRVIDLMELFVSTLGPKLSGSTFTVHG